jgi:predicted transcriptional regulator
MDLEEKDQAFSDYDEQDGGDVKPLPNFIPPEAQKAPAAPAAAPADQVAVEPVEQQADKVQPPQIDGVPADAAVAQNPAASTAEGAGLSPAVQQADAAPDAEAEVVTEIEPEVVTEPERRNEHIEDAEYEDVVPEAEAEAAAKGDKVTLDRATYEALMGVAKKVNAGAMLVDPDELQRVNAAVQQGGMIPGAGPTQGQQQVKTGAQALAEGGMSLLGGAAALTGAALKAGGKVASSLAGALRERDGSEAQEAPAAGVAVLPRISEYRVDQAEKAANAYEDAMQKLWESGNLPNVRKEIEERARQTGLSVEDVMDKMKPNGEMSDLHEKFRTAVAESPDAQTNKKAMDKALDGWVRQYGRGQEELLNPETEGNPHFEALRDRLDNSHGRMQKNTANAPLFEGEDKSHAEKLRETIQRIMEKLKEIAKDFVNMVRGKKGADAEADNDPSP